MPHVCRRSFLKGTAALLSTSAAPLFPASGRITNLGVQLYTVRNVIKRDPLETLRAIEEIGYREAELISNNWDELWPFFKQTKLKAVSLHIDPGLFFGTDQAQVDRLLDTAKDRGLGFVVFPYLPPERRGKAATYQELAKTLNDAGERAHQRGLALCYHNHAFEFGDLGGTTPLDILMRQTQKGLVSLELDVFWASVAGHNPLELLHKYPGRVKLLHLKDKDRDQAIQFNENVPKSAFKEVGSGSLDFSAILRSARAQGIAHFFVEQDQTPGDPIASLRKSFEYVNGLSV